MKRTIDDMVLHSLSLTHLDDARARQDRNGQTITNLCIVASYRYRTAYRLGINRSQRRWRLAIRRALQRLEVAGKARRVGIKWFLVPFWKVRS